ncbi:hypothetical protein [Actinosynnema sp. NPDC020468]|uniref:hypothetical protein n=1 Tax=Actinosynnema sp. NPDC020468 TaxID=3154488 RepID=UPI0033DF199E
MRRLGVDLRGYLDLYGGHSAVLRAEASPVDYPHTVATTWEVSFEALSPAARHVQAVTRDRLGDGRADTSRTAARLVGLALSDEPSMDALEAWRELRPHELAPPEWLRERPRVAGFPAADRDVGGVRW